MAVTPPGGFTAIDDYPGVETNIDLLSAATPFAGHFVIRPDVDGTVRRYSLLLRHAGEYYPSLALRAASVVLGGEAISLHPYGGSIPAVRLGGRDVPASERGELLINYRGPYGRTFPYVPAVDVLESKAGAAELLRDRLVFIGATETGIGDIRTMPFDLTVPGVEMHATVADNLIHDRYVRSSAAQTIEGILAMFLLGPIAGLIAGRARRPLAGAAAAAGLGLAWCAVAQSAFSFASIHLPLVLPLAAGALGYAAETVHRTVFLEAKSRQIRKTFQQFVSPAIVEEMLRDPDRVKLGGERRELTVLFSDIRGFTTASEKLPPEKVVGLLNEYLTPMTRIVIDAGGTIDKYMGDAIMAFFGAPVSLADHASRAAASALAMRARLVELNAGLAARGFDPIGIGIGINTGVMSVGNMGSDMIFDYTVIGDAVNLGSRIEGLNKYYGTDILVSGFTAAALPPEFVLREIDRVRVKGKNEPVAVFEIVGREADRPSQFLDAWSAALAAYRSRDFEGALGRFELCLAMKPGDGPARVYIERSRELQASPPVADWDAVHTAESK